MKYPGWPRTDDASREGGFVPEAAIAVLAVFAVFSLFLSLIRTAAAQQKIQLALDRTALEISALSIPGEAVSDAAAALLLPEQKKTGENGAAAVLTELLQSIAGEAVSHAAADILCRTMMPAYLWGDGTDETLRALGVPQGMDGLDFSLSTVSADGKQIRLCAVYEVRFGLSETVCLRFPTVQTAVTSSFAHPVLLPEKKEKAEEKKEAGVWALGNFLRGKQLTEMIKSENPAFAIRGGFGIDVYDCYSNEYTSVVSLNPFTPTYSVFTPPEESQTVTADCYRLEERAAVGALKKNASALKKSIAKLGAAQELPLERGGGLAVIPSDAVPRLTVIIPEEAEAFAEQLDRAAREVTEKTGVRIEFRRKDWALETP